MRSTFRSLSSVRIVATLVFAMVLLSIQTQTQFEKATPSKPSSLNADGSGWPPVKGGSGGHVLLADGSGWPPVKGGGGGHIVLADGSGWPPIKGGSGGGHIVLPDASGVQPGEAGRASLA